MKTVSYETAKQLVEAGLIIENTEKSWDAYEWRGKTQTTLVTNALTVLRDSLIPAPTLCEMFVTLPHSIWESDDEWYTLTMLKTLDMLSICYNDDENNKRLNRILIQHENPAEAAALLWLELAKLGLLSK